MQNNPLVDDYIAAQAPEAQAMLQELRTCIFKALPKGEEVISYAMPAYRQSGMVCYFAAFKKHIGFYPTSTPIAHFSAELADYKTSKGAIQFPLGTKLPLSLIKKIIAFKVAELAENNKNKK